jgi:hypothetical protein
VTRRDPVGSTRQGSTLPESSIAALRAAVVASCAEPDFVHHEWYVEFHLEIVERIALELLALYPEANRTVVQALVWTHDLPKILGVADPSDRRCLELLDRAGIVEPVSRQLLEEVEVLDSKNLDGAAAEVRIVSSADGCSHLVGPFLSLWWREHPQMSVHELMAENQRKIEVAWRRKICLSEARAAFRPRYELLREQTGLLPATFL